MCLMQIINYFCGKSQGSCGQMEVLTRSGQRRGLIGGNLTHLLLLTSNFPSFISEYKQPSHALAGSQAKWRITDVYLEFWEPSLPDFEEAVGRFACIIREA